MRVPPGRRVAPGLTVEPTDYRAELFCPPDDGPYWLTVEAPDGHERDAVAIDYYPDGRCVAEAISHHRSCSASVQADAGGPTGALRALADQIDANEDRWQRVPD